MKFTKVLLFIIVALMLTVAIQPVMAQVSTHATTSGFGAAFGYAQTIGNTSYVQTGGIGNAHAGAWAMTDVSFADSAVWTHGNAAAFSTAFGSPFGSGSFVQVASFFNGHATGFAASGP